VLWDKCPIEDLIVYRIEQRPEKHIRNPPELFQMIWHEPSGPQTNFLLTLDVALDGSQFPLFRARNQQLTEHQRKLTHRSYCVHVGIVKQHTSIAIEHLTQETRKKSRETCLPGETLEETAVSST
jgi:hypothetical protein